MDEPRFVFSLESSPFGVLIEDFFFLVNYGN